MLNFETSQSLNFYRKILIFTLITVLSISCKTKSNNEELDKLSVTVVHDETETNFESLNVVESAFSNALKVYTLQIASAKQEGKIPRTLGSNGEIMWTDETFDWTEGFFPGSLWYLFEETEKEYFKNEAINFQELFLKHQFVTTNHDLGFIFNSSYGNGYRLTGSEEMRKVILNAANSLITRFNPVTGCIQSWDVSGTGGYSARGWLFPVIIDNMMNLELLFKATELSNDDTYKNIAISHIDTTLKNHFRDDYSSYHVVDYDPNTGEVRSRQTAQGLSDDSAWARGQAWGLYGFTMAYRFTNNALYLEHAEKIADFIIKHSPADGVPYWDYNASQNNSEPRDASAAAVTFSALIELDEYSLKDYRQFIDKLMQTLSSKSYTAEIGENGNFIIKHCVGSIPHQAEIDVPLNYADYYYLEGLLRYKSKFL